MNTFNRKLSNIIPMSDMRAGYLVGTLIISLGLIFGLVAFAYTSTTSVELAAVNPFSVAGHVSMIVTDEYGNIKSYIQTDNRVTDTFKDCVLAEFFGGGATCGVMDFIAIGFNGTAESDAQTSLFTQFTRNQSTGASTLTTTLNQGSENDSADFEKVGPVVTITSAMMAIGIVNNAAAGPGVICSDLIAGDGIVESCRIREVGLLDAAATDMYGRTVLGAGLQPFIKVGDTVQANYTGEIGGQP